MLTSLTRIVLGLAIVCVPSVSPPQLCRHLTLGLSAVKPGAIDSLGRIDGFDTAQPLHGEGLTRRQFGKKQITVSGPAIGTGEQAAAARKIAAERKPERGSSQG